MKKPKKGNTLVRTILLGTNIPIVVIIALIGLLSTLQLEHQLSQVAAGHSASLADYAAALVSSQIENSAKPADSGRIQDVLHSLDSGTAGFVILFDSANSITAGRNRLESLMPESQQITGILNKIRNAEQSVQSFDTEQGLMRAHVRPIASRDLILAYLDPAAAYQSISMRFRLLVFIAILTASLVVSALIRIILRKTLAPIRTIRDISDSVADGDLSRRMTLSSNNEMGDLARFFNTVIDAFAELVTAVHAATGVLLESIDALTDNAEEITSTASQQAAAASEVLSTMEDADTLSKNVAVRIREVVKIANATKESVQKGFTLITASLDKMNEIRETNGGTIGGIKTLGGQIESIWEIVTIINGIADQTKIIAFNAELEAASAGEAGKNFQIVAGEIRRLADSTVESTNEIKSRINEIQHASDKLIIASEEGTRKIGEGWDISHNIRGVFEEVLSSSEISAASAEDIARSIKMQVASFEQIFMTLKQISEGINRFASSTRNTSDSSDQIRAIAEEFAKTVECYRTGEELYG